MDLDQPNSQMKGREELQDVIKRHEPHQNSRKQPEEDKRRELENSFKKRRVSDEENYDSFVPNEVSSDHQGRVYQDLEPIPTPAQWSSMSRLERKRFQEKRRRLDFKEALDKLLGTLLRHDDDFQKEAKQREKRAAGRAATSPHLANYSDNALFNRVEMVNQAAWTVEKLGDENKLLRDEIEDIQAGRKSQPSDTSPSASRKVAFHHGVGPVFISSPSRASCDDLSSGTPINQSLPVGSRKTRSDAEIERPTPESTDLAALRELVTLHRSCTTTGALLDQRVLLLAEERYRQLILQSSLAAQALLSPDLLYRVALESLLLGRSSAAASLPLLATDLIEGSFRLNSSSLLDSKSDSQSQLTAEQEETTQEDAPSAYPEATMSAGNENGRRSEGEDYDISVS